MRFQIFIVSLSILAPWVTSFNFKCNPRTGGLSSYVSNNRRCDVHSLTITTPNEVITSVNGVTTPTTFQGLYFLNLIVHYLPKGIGIFFPQLKVMNIQSSALLSIQAADLEGLSNLGALVIQHHAITELSSDLFKFTPKMIDVVFFDGQISQVGKDLFANLCSVRNINFKKNYCIDKGVTSNFEIMKQEIRTMCPHSYEKSQEVEKEKEIDALKSHKTRLELEITQIRAATDRLAKQHENEINSLKAKKLQTDTELGKEIENLKSQKSSMEVEISQLKTENERLKRTCSHGLLDSSTSLLKCNHENQDNQMDETYCQAERLELINPGTKLSVGMAENGDKIKQLYIVDQKMVFMPSNLSETLPNLIQLVVEKSQLTALHTTDFQGMTSLKEIRIERNNISLIEKGVFDEIPQVVHLNLAYNNIKALPLESFAMLTNMKTLVLSGNGLSKFTASFLPRRNVIENFQLQKNLLKFIESKIFKLLRNADLIDFSDNTCIDMKYQKSETGSATLKEMLGHIDLECDESGEHS